MVMCQADYRQEQSQLVITGDSLDTREQEPEVGQDQRACQVRNGCKHWKSRAVREKGAIQHQHLQKRETGRHGLEGCAAQIRSIMSTEAAKPQEGTSLCLKGSGGKQH